MMTCFRCGATYPDLTVHHCGTGAAMYVQVPDRFEEGYQAGRLATLREVLGHEMMSGTWKGAIMAAYVHRLLAEAESGEQERA